MSIKRWSVAEIAIEFSKNPKAKITMSEADMNGWLLNSDNTIYLHPHNYTVFFEKRNSGIWEASLKREGSVKAEKGLRFK